MVRISGVTIPDNKRIEVALTYIFGIGKTQSNIILNTTGISPDRRASELTPDEINKIQGVVDKNYKIEGELKREITNNVKRLKEINSWRGYRLARRLPQHGRTKTNSRTMRGNIRKTMGSGRKPAAAKT